jgi:hyperosmotically inducible protein
MQRYSRVALAVLSLAFLLAAAPAPVQTDATSVIEGVRKQLLQLPYYGVFDFIAFSYDKGTVTLMGYAYRPTLKADAERAVKRVQGVDTVVNKMEVLPPSPADDEVRWNTYYAIYGDPFLSRYAPGGGMLWGHSHAYSGPFSPIAGEEFPGMEPAGNYPIHIIVKNLGVTLLGVVDSEQDKTVAGLKARQVPGVLDVKNELVVESDSSNKR